MMSMQTSNIPFYVLETKMCKLTKNLPIQIQGVLEFSGFRGGGGFDKGEGEIREGLKPPSELCTYQT